MSAIERVDMSQMESHAARLERERAYLTLRLEKLGEYLHEAELLQEQMLEEMRQGGTVGREKLDDLRKVAGVVEVHRRQLDEALARMKKVIDDIGGINESLAQNARINAPGGTA